MKNETEKIILAGLFIAIGSVLPLLFHQVFIGQDSLGKLLSPMHFPVLIAGMVLGYRYGLAVGIITPLLNSVMFSMPPLFPMAVSMALELGTYGLIAGLLYRKIKFFRSDVANIYISLLIAMVLGRIVYGLSMGTIASITDTSYGFSIFINSVLISSIPGIILQILTVPAIVKLVGKSEARI